jgi:hypothetical protein
MGIASVTTSVAVELFSIDQWWLTGTYILENVEAANYARSREHTEQEVTDNRADTDTENRVG